MRVIAAVALGSVTAAVMLAGLCALAIAQSAPITLADAGGRPIARLDAHRETVKVRDARDQPLGEIKIQADRVKLADAGGAERWKVKRKDYGAEIENAGGQRLFRIRKDKDGDWKLEDASKAVLVRVKAKSSGVELRDAGGKTIAKVKPRAGGLVFETEAGARLGEVSGITDVHAGLWLALDRFSPAERAALWAFFANVAK